MSIYLVQHGKSLSKEEDPNRPLSDIGIQEVKDIAKKLNEYDISLNEIFHSNKLRAKQTAEIFQQFLNPPSGIVEISGINPKDDVHSFAKNLSKTMDIMYVGHLPFMVRLVSFLITGDESKKVIVFQNAGIVTLRYIDEEGWVIVGTLFPKAV